MKRTSQLRRTSSLQRSRMKRRPRRARVGDDPRYLAWVRSLPCCAPVPFCIEPSQAHHRTGAGMGRKVGDLETMPLCAEHHRDLHEFTGPFKDWRRATRAAWQDLQIIRLRALYTRAA